MATKPVVVGADGSEESLRAVEWAALEARRHSSPLRIVSASAQVPRMHTLGASNSKASTALAATAPNAHLYGGNSHDQPSSSPMPMVSMITGPSPGTWRSSDT